jgi:hypothetical protein
MQKSVSFRGFRPLDTHQGFALDPLGASRQPQDPLPSSPPPPSEILDPPLVDFSIKFLSCMSSNN